MLVIKLQGGLGNQLFLYGLYEQLKYIGRSVKIDDESGYLYDRFRKPVLNYLGVSYEKATRRDVQILQDAQTDFYHILRRKLFGRSNREYNLNGLGKDAAQIISRINGFTYVETEYDPYTNTVKEVFRKCYSKDENSPRAKVNCYGANDVCEGVAIMWKENVDVSITGNSTNPTRFQHPVAGTYKKERIEAGKKYFSVASGGGTGRTLHPDNMAAGPASYGMTDTMGRMHSDAQFAGSSSVPAHVEMMGLIGAGNNPMVGMTVSTAVSIEEAAKAGKF